MQPPRRCQDGGQDGGLRSRVRPASGGAAESRGWNAGAEGRVSPNLAHHDLQRKPQMDLMEICMDFFHVEKIILAEMMGYEWI